MIIFIKINLIPSIKNYCNKIFSLACHFVTLTIRPWSFLLPRSTHIVCTQCSLEEKKIISYLWKIDPSPLSEIRQPQILPLDPAEILFPGQYKAPSFSRALCISDSVGNGNIRFSNFPSAMHHLSARRESSKEVTSTVRPQNVEQQKRSSSPMCAEMNATGFIRIYPPPT